jgi:ribosomal protein S18 acetylase RimI-like enzyme
VRRRPLTEVSSRELRALLDEEVACWGEELLWDFRDISSAVASSLDHRALTGYVIQDGPRAIAYGYYMLECERVILGSLFASAGFRQQGLEDGLLETLLLDAQRHPGNDRVECQTLFSTLGSALPYFAKAGFESRGRHYLVRELNGGLPSLPQGFMPRTFRRDDIARAAWIVYRSHQGSLDAALNLTYSSVASCRNFIETVVLREGCGRFEPEASFVAEGPEGPWGILLASRLSRTNGHICQVSVLPEAQAQGLGTALMAWALHALRREGMSAASLSVTVDNRAAYRLYERLGFRLHKEFAAHAWVRPPARIELPGTGQ